MIKFTVILVLLVQGRLLAAEGEFAQAQRLLLTGKYSDAEEIFRPGAEKSSVAAIGLARCFEAEGKRDEARRELTMLANGNAGKNADVQAELARLAFERGDRDEARKRAAEAIRLAPENVLARYIEAEIARTSGRIEEAERIYRLLVEFYNNHDIREADALHWIGRATARYARWNRLSDQFGFLVNQLYPDALKLEPNDWRAHYESGILFLEKCNHADAAREFQAALEINPRAAEVYAAMASMALDSHDIEGVESSLHRALEIDPNSLAARRLQADMAWFNLQVPGCLKLLQEKVLPLNPRDEETLGRIAACYLMLDGPAEDGHVSRFDRLAEEVTHRNAHAGDFYFTLAEALETRNKQAEAEAYFREAIRVMPREAGYHVGLGLLIARTGREIEARSLLKDAFAADPFQVRVKNTLEVLDVLDSMSTLTTEHFVLKYGKDDALLARYVSPRLEGIYDELRNDYGYAPPERTPVEIFRESRGLDGHAWFSARLIGMPYLGTVAASTGRIVGMTSPNEPGIRAFNWARVLKHEMTHIFNLQETRFNVPHWFTEGLAVRNEDTARPQSWYLILRKRLARAKLFDLATIDSGFSRPMSGDDCQLAYCQGELYVEYMLSRGGPDVLRKMLAAYTESPLTARAIDRAFGTSQAEFEKGYLAFLKAMLRSTPRLGEIDEASVSELEAAHRERPKDADAAARLAYAYLRIGAEREAVALAGNAIELNPKQQLATYIVVRLESKRKPSEEAAAALDACLDRKLPNPLALNLLAGLKFKMKKYGEAAELYALGERLDPTNPRWTASLAKVYLATEDRAGLFESLARLARADADDLPTRKKLAELALARHDAEAACGWATEAVRIKVNDGEAHRLLAEALAGLDRLDESIVEYETAIGLDPSRTGLRIALAHAYVRAKRIEKARQVLESILKETPDDSEAKALLESLPKSR